MLVNNSWLVNSEQTKLLRLVRVFRTLVAVGYTPVLALRHISQAYQLDRTEFSGLISLVNTKGQ